MESIVLILVVAFVIIVITAMLALILSRLFNVLLEIDMEGFSKFVEKRKKAFGKQKEDDKPNTKAKINAWDLMPVYDPRILEEDTEREVDEMFEERYGDKKESEPVTIRETLEVIKKETPNYSDAYFMVLEVYYGLSEYNLRNDKNHKEAKDIINEYSVLEVHLLEDEAILVYRAWFDATGETRTTKDEAEEVAEMIFTKLESEGISFE